MRRIVGPIGVRESGDTDPRDRRARRRTSYNEEGVRYAREKIGDVYEDDGGGDEEDEDDDDEDGGGPTDHLLTFLAPASHVRSSPAVGGSHSARSHSGSRSSQAIVCVGDADSRGRLDDSRPQPAAPRRRDAVIRRSATGDRGGGSAPPRFIVVAVGGGDGDVLANGGISPTVDRGRIVPEITAGNGASWCFFPRRDESVPFGKIRASVLQFAGNYS